MIISRIDPVRTLDDTEDTVYHIREGPFIARKLKQIPSQTQSNCVEEVLYESL